MLSIAVLVVGAPAVVALPGGLPGAADAVERR